MEGKEWNEIHLTGDRRSYTLHELQCGTAYSFYLVAYNSAGHGNSSEIVSAKTEGSGKIFFYYLEKLCINARCYTEII